MEDLLHWLKENEKMKKLLFIIFIVINSLIINAQPVDKDRWIIMDFAWFRPETLKDQADSLFNRYLPLWQNATGDKGIIFSFNWVVDLITDYEGDINQKLPLKSPNSEWWNDKTYNDVKEFIALLRDKAKSEGLNNFHIGMECIAWPSLVMVQGKYNYPSYWSERHPELYQNYGAIDPLCKLKPDKKKYAARPNGIRKGEYFSAFFGEQWGIVSKDLNMDVLLLWDSWATLRCYTRSGVFGDRASKDPEKNKEISDAIIRTFRDIKKGNPDALLIGYSSGASAIGELRVNTFDLEALVADGHIDIWIDQTWGGAWNDFWGFERNGWTFQLAYQLQHALMIEAGNANRSNPCKHYNIVAPFDAYEPWDIIHSTPEKLKWSIWAYNNASIITPKGYKQVDGSVIAWCNSPFMQLLSEQDVSLISENLDAADASASEISRMYGASFIYNRPEMDWLNQKDPSSFNSEWIDEQAAMLMKWGISCMSASRIEWLKYINPEKRVLMYQLPGELEKNTFNHINELALKGWPQLFIGRAGRIDKQLLNLAGVSSFDTLYLTQDHQCIIDEPGTVGLPGKSHVFLSEINPVQAKAAKVFVRTPASPLLTKSYETSTYYWQPPDWRHPSQPGLDQNQYGSLVPYYITSRELLYACRDNGITHIKPTKVMNPVTMNYWRSGNKIYFLLGNIESNTIGDSRTIREIIICVNRDELKLQNNNYVLKDHFSNQTIDVSGEENNFLLYPVKIDPEGMGLYHIDL